jgi:hypothetical protein
MFYDPDDAFVQVAPRYPDRLTVCVANGVRSAIKRAAQQQHTTPAELVRRVLAEKVEELARHSNSSDARSAA